MYSYSVGEYRYSEKQKWKAEEQLVGRDMFSDYSIFRGIGVVDFP